MLQSTFRNNAGKGSNFTYVESVVHDIHAAASLKLRLDPTKRPGAAEVQLKELSETDHTCPENFPFTLL